MYYCVWWRTFRLSTRPRKFSIPEPTKIVFSRKILKNEQKFVYEIPEFSSFYPKYTVFSLDFTELRFVCTTLTTRKITHSTLITIDFYWTPCVFCIHNLITGLKHAKIQLLGNDTLRNYVPKYCDTATPGIYNCDTVTLNLI